MTVQLLLDEWKKQRPEYKSFCNDGVLVETEWTKSSPKILFLLKETYESFTDIVGPMGPYGTSKTFWRKMKIWTYIVTEYYNGRIPDFETSLKVKESPNDSVAYVNLKKNAVKKEYNNEAYSDHADLISYVKNDSVFLKSQISLINPDIIFCCSTFNFIHELYHEVKNVADNLYRTSEFLVVDYYHPSNRMSYVKEFDKLSSTAKNLL